MPGFFVASLPGNEGTIARHWRSWTRRARPAARTGSPRVQCLRAMCSAACTTNPASSTYLSGNGTVQWIRAAPSLLSRCIFVVCQEVREIDDDPFCNPCALVALKLFGGPNDSDTISAWLRTIDDMPETTFNVGQTLTKVPIFSGLAENELVFLAQRAVPRHYSAGEIVFSEGEPCVGL